MSSQWTQFDDHDLQRKLIHKAAELGVDFSVEDNGRVSLDGEEWGRHNDPYILFLDEEFGSEWVAVYADDPAQRDARIALLRERGVKFVVWHDQFMGTSIVLDRVNCPVDWEIA